MVKDDIPEELVSMEWREEHDEDDSESWRSKHTTEENELLGPWPAVSFTMFPAGLLRLIKWSFAPQQPTAHTRVSTPMADAYQ